MKIIIDNMRLQPDQSLEGLKKSVQRRYSINGNFSLDILKRSLDARKKHNIFYNHRVLVELEDSEGKRLLSEKDIAEYVEKKYEDLAKNNSSKKSVIVVGSGPAGLFSALRLISYGFSVTVLERGKAVEDRMEDIKNLEKTGELDLNSNVLFGEGGAGTYSDGKLTTRTNRKEISWFYDKLLKNGADPEIAYSSKPHIGTNKLQRILKSMQNEIIESGSKIVFNSKVTEFITQDDKVLGVKTFNEEYTADAVILAIGHSARDSYDMLLSSGVAMAKKDFAIGLRVEHPAEMIRDLQYGNSKYKKDLPAAEYSLVHNNKKTGRGIYSFCMCPGGVVINSSSEKDKLCVNGMSYSKRDGIYSNSAIVVTVKAAELKDSPLAGIELQREIEANAFKLGGGDYVAPAQRVTSFMQNKLDSDLPENSYAPGTTTTIVQNYLPKWVTSELKGAISNFDKKMKGFISDEALLIGAETRTSSPVRILREKNFESQTHSNLYPIGEGAGYAGGIVSSAVDGIRAADAIVANL